VNGSGGTETCGFGKRYPDVLVIVADDVGKVRSAQARFHAIDGIDGYKKGLFAFADQVALKSVRDFQHQVGTVLFNKPVSRVKRRVVSLQPEVTGGCDF